MKKVFIFISVLISALALFLCCSINTYAWEYEPISQTIKSSNLMSYDTMSFKSLPSDYFEPPSQEEIDEYGISQWYEFNCDSNTTYTFFALINNSSSSCYVRLYNQTKDAVIFGASLGSTYVRRQFSSANNTKIYFCLYRGENLRQNASLSYCMVKKGSISYPDNYTIKDYEPYLTYFNKNNVNLGYLPRYTMQFSISSDESTWTDTLKTNAFWSYDNVVSYGATSARISFGSIVEEETNRFLKLYIDYVDYKQKANNFMVTLGHYGDILTINYDDNTSDRVDTINGNYTFQFNNNKNINQIIFESVHSDDSFLEFNYIASGYNQGYNQGYNDGELVGYDSGYNQGYNQGLNDGEINGGLETSGFKSLINTIISYPINLIKTSLSFEIFGINVAGVIFFLLTLGLVIFVVKKFWK